MNTQDKSLKLAELDGRWGKEFIPQVVKLKVFNPYSDDERGLAQFAAILLKFPEVMHKCFMVEGDSRLFLLGGYPATQEYILDKILRMNGVELCSK